MAARPTGSGRIEALVVINHEMGSLRPMPDDASMLIAPDARGMNGSRARQSHARAGSDRRPLAAADVMTAAEVARLMHVSKSTVEDWARRGIVPSRKIGRRRLYIRARIEALLLEDSAGGTL